MVTKVVCLPLQPKRLGEKSDAIVPARYGAAMTEASENEHLEDRRVELPPDEDERIERLQIIFAGDLHGEVDGVLFDLRHELLPPAEWFLPILGNIADITLTSPDVPLIWFPWFDNYYVEAGRLIRRDQSGKKSNNHTRKALTFVRKFGLKNPESIVEAGDKIIVDKVTINKYLADDELEHLHDSETRHAFLKIVKKNGSIDTPFTPLVCRGRTAILLAGSKSDFIHDILKRASLLYKLGADTQHITIEDHGIFAYSAFDNANKYIAMLNDEKYADCLEFATVAAKLGYFWAKAETELRVKILAKIGEKTQKNGRELGLKFGEVRRQNARDGWEKTARELAKELRAKNPTYSQDTLTARIATICDQQKIEMKGLPMIKKLISSMEKAGELPPRKKG